MGDDIPAAVDACMEVEHSLDWLDRLDAWRRMAKPTSRWRRSARATIDIAIQEWLVSDTHPVRLVTLDDEKSLLDEIDEAYPFGERAMEPYKAWRAERKLFRERVFHPAPGLDLPTADDLAACEVAADLVERAGDGDVEAARKLLDDQAPRRLNVKCPACSSPVGQPCRDAEVDVKLDASYPPDRTRMQMGYSDRVIVKTDRLVPHFARLATPGRAR